MHSETKIDQQIEACEERSIAQIEQTLEKEAPEILKAVPKEKRAELVRVVTAVASFQGPLPPPSLLKGYEDIVPGSAKDIIEEFKSIGSHTREQENKLVNHSTFVAKCGQIFAFLLGLTGLLGGVYLCSTGNNWGGLGIAGSSLCALVGSFLKSLHNESANNRENESREPVKSSPPEKKGTTNQRNHRKSGKR